jgi:hypothetical protein
MHGDLEGIAGKVLPAIKLLELAPEELVDGNDGDGASWLEEEEKDEK